MVRLLLSQGANAKARDEKDITPLHLAAFGGWTGVVDELLSAGVLTDALTAAQQTPLHFASESPNPSLAVVLALLQRQSNPRAMDLEGVTPLHIAVRKGSVAMVALFLKSIPYLHDIKKLLALAGSNEEITQMLQKRQQHPPYRLQSPVKHTQLPYQGNRLVNVVFVHGYFHSPETTWSDGSFQFTWPEKYLPISEARARVFFWDRLLELTDFSSLENVYELGKRLLDYVVLNVYSNGVTSHSGSGSWAEPLVFVSHSLGGLVVKAAIAEATHSPLLANTKGIAFLGTPHMGLDPHSMNEAVGKIVQRAVNNRLDPGQGALSSYQRGARRNRTGKDLDDYSKLELKFIETCRDRHIKVLTFAEEASQLVSLDCAFYPPSFAPNITVKKKHENLGTVDDTHDIVYGEILRFLLTVLAERSRPRSGIENLPVLESQTYVPDVPFPPQSPSRQLQVVPLSGNAMIHRPQESWQSFFEEIQDVSIVPKRSPATYVPDISKTVNSWLLKHLEQDSNVDAGEPRALKEWRYEPENRGLWVLGNAGTGKTVLMAQIFNQLRKSSRRYQTVAAFFFSGRLPGQRTAVDMLRSILLQILRAREDLVDIVRYESEYRNVLVDLSLPWPILISIYHKTIRIALDLASDSEFIFLLDAPDECDSSDGEGSSSSAEVCLFIQDCLNHKSIKVCFASRPQNEFFMEFDDRVPRLRIEDFNRNDITQYVERRLAETGGSRGKISKTSEALGMDVIQRSQGVMLWVTLTVESLVQGLKNGDTDEQLNRRTQGTPIVLEELYRKMLDEIPLEYRHEAARTHRIVTIAPFPLDIEVLSLAIDDYQVSDEGKTTRGSFRSNLRAIDTSIGFCELGRGDGVESEEQKIRATMRVNSRCGGLLSVRDNNDIRFIHESARAFITQLYEFEGLPEGSTDTDFDPPVNLLSACIIHIKQSIGKVSLETANKDERLTHLISQAFAAAALADTNHKAKRSYLQLFDELADVCWRIQHLQPVQSTSSDQQTMVPGLNRIQDIPRDLYATLLAIRGGMWSYLCDTVDERILTLGDTSRISLLTHLINPKDLDSLPWAAYTIQPGVSRELPPEDVVQTFFTADSTSPTAWARVTGRRNAWGEVLEAGYHVFARDEVPCNPGPAQTYENGYRWVKIMGIFLTEGADVDAIFTKVPFKPRADSAPPLGGSYVEPARVTSTTTTQPTRVRTLEPRQTLQDVMWPQRDYAVEYKRYLNTINDTSKTSYVSSPEPPASPGRRFSGMKRPLLSKILRSGSRLGNKATRTRTEETLLDKTVALEPPARINSGDTTGSGRAGNSILDVRNEPSN
ncbi:hypothetical protein F5Y12DRAFT_371832 [Xylaria sp. FL1777]|nr:hypothetical protein F5Y12DRAFT_371832 [Xylaria sp. FL1777]